MIRVRQRGNFKNLQHFFKNAKKADAVTILKKYGEIGVEALSAATPVATGKTAASWSYKIKRVSGGYTVSWENSNTTIRGENIALLIQYGHGTKSGGYVKGRNYINPAIQPIFDQISEEAWKEVTSK